MRPRAATKAYRIIAHPYHGILYGGQLWSEAEWARRERRRAQWRAYLARKRAGGRRA